MRSAKTRTASTHKRLAAGIILAMLGVMLVFDMITGQIGIFFLATGDSFPGSAPVTSIALRIRTVGPATCQPRAKRRGD